MNELFFYVILGAIVGIPVIALLVYELQPEWYKQDQALKYVKVTSAIFILCIIVLILELLGIIK